MSADEMKATVFALLGEIAPEADLDSLDPEEDLRDELDLDSMDILKLAQRLAEKTGVEIPEADYPRIVTVDGAVRYLESRATK